MKNKKQKTNEIIAISIATLSLLVVGFIVYSRYGISIENGVSSLASGGTSSAPSIKIISPNGGETLTVGQSYTIKWNSKNVSKVNIFYSTGPGSLDSIAYNIPNTDSYTWTVDVGNTTNTKFKIEIMDMDPGVVNVETQSANFFTVPIPNQPSLKLISPNGGEILTAGKQYTIKWDSKNVDAVNIGYGNASGMLQNWIVYNIPNTGSYTWTVDVGDTTNTQYKIYIFGYDYKGSANIRTQSANPFTITEIPHIKILAPNGGETLTNGKLYTIKWNSTNINKVSVYYSTGPGSQNMIVNDISNTGSYNWKVNAQAYNKYKMEIVGCAIGVCQYVTQSANVFTIK